MNVCHVNNPADQVLLINAYPGLAAVGFHEIIELLELRVTRVNGDFDGFTAFNSITALLFYGITAF